MNKKSAKAIILSIQVRVLTVYVSDKRKDIAFIERKRENSMAKE